MRPPLRFAVYELIKEKKHATDEELLDILSKGEGYSMHELNKALLDLEILGMISGEVGREGEAPGRVRRGRCGPGQIRRVRLGF